MKKKELANKEKFEQVMTYSDEQIASFDGLEGELLKRIRSKTLAGTKDILTGDEFDMKLDIPTVTDEKRADGSAGIFETNSEVGTPKFSFRVEPSFD